jgi:transposase
LDFILALRARYERLEARVEKVEEQLRESSRNSSRPPSQDPPGAEPQRPQKPSGRRAGGQPGHPGRQRPLLPIETVDRVVEHFPERCACGHRFAEPERDPIGDPARHQVSELPPTAVEVTEHRLHRLRAPTAALPPARSFRQTCPRAPSARSSKPRSRRCR